MQSFPQGFSETVNYREAFNSLCQPDLPPELISRLAAGIAGEQLEFHTSAAFYLCMLIVLMLLTFIPEISMFLPNLLMK